MPDGRKLSQMQIAKEKGVSCYCITRRASRCNDDINLILDDEYWKERQKTSKGRRKKIFFHGKKYDANSFSNFAGCHPTSLLKWFRLGLTPDTILKRIMYDGVVLPGEKTYTGQPTKEWKQLSNKRREHNLKKIKEPTRFDLIYGVM